MIPVLYKQTKLILKKFLENMIKTTLLSESDKMAKSCPKLSGRGRKELPIKRVREKRGQKLF